MGDIIYYAACATRRMITHKDIREEKPCSSYEEAADYENKFMHDDDDWGVIANMNGVWFRVWGRSASGELLVTDEGSGLSCGLRSAQPLSGYITDKITL